MLVFKTSAFNRSATSPRSVRIIHLYEYSAIVLLEKILRQTALLAVPDRGMLAPLL